MDINLLCKDGSGYQELRPYLEGKSMEFLSRLPLHVICQSVNPEHRLTMTAFYKDFIAEDHAYDETSGQIPWPHKFV